MIITIIRTKFLYICNAFVRTAVASENNALVNRQMKSPPHEATSDEDRLKLYILIPFKRYLNAPPHTSFYFPFACCLSHVMLSTCVWSAKFGFQFALTIMNVMQNYRTETSKINNIYDDPAYE